MLDKAKYPFWSVAALSTSNAYFLGGPLQGCGQCFQIECLQNGGPHAVRRAHSLLHQRAQGSGLLCRLIGHLRFRGEGNC